MSSADVKYFIEVFVTLFVIMDPPGTVPIFSSSWLYNAICRFSSNRMSDGLIRKSSRFWGLKPTST